MTDPAVGIKDLLETESVGTFAALTGFGIFIGKQPDANDTSIVITNTGGEAPNPKFLLDFPSVQVMVRGAKGGYQAAFAKAVAVQDALLGVSGCHIEKARLSLSQGRPESAYAYYDSARVQFEAQYEARLHWPLFLANTHAHLGIAYAGLGQKLAAVRESEKAVELLPVSKDAIDGAHIAWHVAETYAQVGEADASIDQLELLLSVPSAISVHVLRLDPIWDPLRSHPRFQALLEKYDTEQ